MIIIQAEGGLGNQMFQCALGLSFISRGITVKFDLSKFETQHTHNGYELERVFNLKQQYCSKTERAIVKSISKIRHIILTSPYKEKTGWQWRYHEDVNKLNSGFLKGYWQCEKYFAGAASLVKEKFIFPLLQDEINRKMLDKIKNCNAVSLHIRRGDYLNAGISASIATSYYKEAMNLINDKITNPCYFVFSDDMDWAKENIKEKQTEFIDWNKKDKSYIDMQLMANCKHNIIANSSFSWWGAWLNNNAGKMVIAPQPWMPAMQGESDIIPGGWIKINAGFIN